jgi:hypothetical protein
VEDLRETAYEKLLPPLVAKIRKEVFAWRETGYAGASATSAALLAHWFETEHLLENADGTLSPFCYYIPDFIVRAGDGTVWIVETKGREELDLPQKMARLKQWCADATAADEGGRRYDFVFVDQKGFEKHQPQTFSDLAASFMDYKA